MKRYKTLIILFLFVFAMRISAQVTFVIQSLPAYTPQQDILYIAGDFSAWNAGLSPYKLQKNGEGRWSITLAAQAAGTVLNFKFTRGTWETVEKGPAGEEIGNRTFTYGNNSTVNVTIANWADAGGTPISTAAANVKIMSNDFYMPQFDRTRRIWLYLPPDYETSVTSFPVLYMHDGQNLFDTKTSYAGEWEVDESLNKLASQGKRVPIVVGIDNGSQRIAEYTPWKNTQYGGGDGEKYIQFIVETLKPYIDQHYRTMPDRDNTGIMGSSLGGLISHYGSLKYQEIFSKAGLFSPSYWFSDSVWAFTNEEGKRQNMQIYQLCGDSEGDADVVIDMKRMNDSLLSLGYGQDKVFKKIVTGGQHNEKLWREAFSEAYLWLFDSYITSVEKPAANTAFKCTPNPVLDILIINSDIKFVFDTIMIFDISGRNVKTIIHPSGNIIDVHDILPGTYIIRCSSGAIQSEGRFIKK